MTYTVVSFSALLSFVFEVTIFHTRLLLSCLCEIFNDLLYMYKMLLFFKLVHGSRPGVMSRLEFECIPVWECCHLNCFFILNSDIVILSQPVEIKTS